MRKRVEICNKFDICSDQYYTDTVKRPVAINRNKMYMISMNKHAVKKHLKHEAHHKKQIDDKDRKPAPKERIDNSQKILK